MAEAGRVEDNIHRRTRERYEELERSMNLKDRLVMKDIAHVYHTTFLIRKFMILRSSTLRKEVMYLARDSPLNGQISGVFLECNLSTGNALPSQSSNGSNRLRLPISGLRADALHLFFNSWYWGDNGERYVLLVLVKESQHKDYKFCTQHLHELDIKTNCLLRLDFDGDTFKYYFDRWNPIWLEMVVVGDVQLPSEQEWERTHYVPYNLPQQ